MKLCFPRLVCLLAVPSIDVGFVEIAKDRYDNGDEGGGGNVATCFVFVKSSPMAHLYNRRDKEKIGIVEGGVGGTMNAAEGR